MTEIITSKNLSKSYGSKTILENLDFTIHAGEVVGLLGANGAGKTTLINLLLGLQPSSAGSIKLFGQAPQTQVVKRRIGVMFQDNLIMKRVRASELLELMRTAYPQALSMKQLEQVADLGANRHNYVDKLSGGQQRKLNFALALVGDPQLLVLDEPTAGMDTTSRHGFWRYIQKLAAQGKTIIVTSHYLAEIEGVASRILFLKDRHLLHDGSLAALRAKFSRNTVEFVSAIAVDQLHLTTGQLELHEGQHYRFSVTNVDQFLQELAPQMTQIQDLQIHQTTLDNIFEQINEE